MVRVTAAFFVLYYILLFVQSYAKIYLLQGGRSFSPMSYAHVRYADRAVAKVKYHNTGHPLAVASDRAVGNMVEQAVPFLVCLWGRRFVVEGQPSHSRWPSTSSLGWSYVTLRAIYPVAFCVGHPWLQLVTVPCYLIVFFCLGDCLRFATLADPSDLLAVSTMAAAVAAVGLAGIAVYGKLLRALTSEDPDRPSCAEGAGRSLNSAPVRNTGRARASPGQSHG